MILKKSIHKNGDYDGQQKAGHEGDTDIKT